MKKTNDRNSIPSTPEPVARRPDAFRHSFIRRNSASDSFKPASKTSARGQRSLGELTVPFCKCQGWQLKEIPRSYLEWVVGVEGASSAVL